MGWLGKAWRWGVVVPLTVSALAGWVADVVTGTWQFWPLIWPSYAVILVWAWRSMSPKAVRAREAERMAAGRIKIAEANAAEAEVAAAEGRRPHLIHTIFDEADLAPDPLIDQPRPVTVWSVLGLVYERFSQVLWSLVITFSCMIASFAAISIGIWGRGYWYIWAPAGAAIAGLVWYVYRPDPNAPKAPDPIVR